MTEQLHTILLGTSSGAARQFIIEGPSRESPISDFSAQIRIGEPSYETRQGAGFGVIETWHLGGGILEGVTREHLGRWAKNTGVDTRIPGYALRPPERITCTVTGSPRGSISPYAGSHSPVLRGSATTGSPRFHFTPGQDIAYLSFISGTEIVIATPTGAAAAYWYGLVALQANDGTERTYGSNGAVLYYTSSELPGVGDWTAFTMPAGRTPCAIGYYGDKLLIHLDNNSVIWSANGTTFVPDSGGSNPDIICYLPAGSQFLGCYEAPWGEAAPYFLSPSGRIYIVNFYTRQAIPSITLPVSDCWCAYQSGFIVGGGGRVLQVIINGGQISTREMPLFPEQGAVRNATVGPAIVCLNVTSDDRIYAGVTGLGADSDGQVWEWNGSAWNPYGIITSSYMPHVIISYNNHGNMLGFSTSTSHDQTFVWSIGYATTALTAYKFNGPQSDRNPLADSAYLYEPSAAVYVETPWLDMGFRELDGVMLEIWCGSTNLNSTKKVQVEYALDGSTSFSNPDGTGSANYLSTQDPLRVRFGTADASGAIPGIEFRRIKFRFTPVGSETVSPNMLPLTLVFRKRGLLRMGYQYTVDANRMMDYVNTSNALTGWSATLTWETIFDFMRTLWASNTLLYLSEPGRTTTRVGIATYNGTKTHLQTDRQRGTITIQLEEPVDGA